MSICTIYFARPGPTHENTPLPPSEMYPNGSWSSSDAAALNDQGISDALKIREKFKDIRFDGCYTSIAQRTIETAEYILKGNTENSSMAPQCVDFLYEMRLGEEWVEKKMVELFKIKTNYPSEESKEICPNVWAARNGFDIKPEDVYLDEWNKEFDSRDFPQKLMYFFKATTGYPSEESKKICPKVWAKRNGGDIQPNDPYLDPWNKEMDNFDDFSEKTIEETLKIAKEHQGKTIVFIPHGTPFKGLIGYAVGLPSHEIKVARGAYAAVTIDALGKIELILKSNEISF